MVKSENSLEMLDLMV